jgi:TolB-like protein/tetratricopeptide (TPR) repeat protein
VSQLLEEIRARKLDRIAAGYAVAAWVVIQAASIVLPTFNAAPWVMQFLIIASIVGFFVTVAGGWILMPAHPDTSPRTRRIFGVFLIAGVLLAVGLGLFAWGHSGNTSDLVGDTSAPAGSNSIAVLPFVNMSGDTKQDYFSDGIAEEILNDLSNTPELRVAARTSSFAFKGRNTDIKQIARALNVRGIVEGSVRQVGQRVRIAAELVDASNGFQIWSESYDRELTDILSLQADIAHSITEAVAQHFLGHGVSATPARPTPQAIDPEAYKAYLRGQDYFAQRTRESIGRAVALFAETTKLAPQYADGFAALANAQATAALDYQVPDSLPAAIDAVNKALALDPNNPTALKARAIAELLQWQWRAAAADLRRMEELHANSASVWHMRAIFFDYMALPQFTGPAEEKAVQLDPLSYIDRYNLALYRMLEKRYDEAARISAEAWKLQPAQPDLHVLNIQIALGRNDLASAERTLATLVSQAGENSPDTVGARFYIEVAKKDFVSARKIVDAVAASFPASGITATDVGTAYAMTNDVSSATKWYRRAYELREPQFPRVPYANPQLTKLFADPRWKTLRATSEIRDWEAARIEIAQKSRRGK